MAVKIITALVVAHTLEKAIELIKKHGLPDNAQEVLVPMKWDHMTMRTKDTPPTTYVLIQNKSLFWMEGVEQPDGNSLGRSLRAFGKHYFGVNSVEAEMDVVVMSEGTGEIILKDRRPALNRPPVWRPYPTEE